MEELHPFISFVEEDKSRYPSATSKGFVDKDNDFLVGDSGGFLLNWSFKFVNTHLFTEAADYYREHETYCKHKKGSIGYLRFWKQEFDRRLRGMVAPCRLNPDGTITNVRITGDHYAYLNYSRINREPNEAEAQEQLRKGYIKPTSIEDFPRFWDGDYWNFKIDEFAEINELNVCKGKARRKGYSYKESASSANRINAYPKVTIIHAAYLEDYLVDPGALSDMTKTTLDWYEVKTHWRRGYLSEDIRAIETGYRTSTGGNKKFGDRSKLLSLTTFNNESAAIGKKSIKLKCEEAGKFNNLQEFIDVTISATESGSINVGTISVFGTGGTKDANWYAFEAIFYNPHKDKFIAFENIWDKDSRHMVCGYFHPNILCYEDREYITMDKWGNSNLRAAYKVDLEDKKRAEESKTISEYVVYCGQRANSPSEAFSRGTENMFTSPELLLHEDRVRHDTDMQYWTDGVLVTDNTGTNFITNKQLLSDDKKSLVHPYIEQVPFIPNSDVHGCIRRYHPPFKQDGIIPNNLYVITADTVGIDKNKEDVTVKNSLNSFIVWLPANPIVGNSADLIVAVYRGRTNNMEEDDRILLNLAKYYNAKRGVLAEVNRGQVVQDFRRWNELQYLMYEPTYAWDTNMAKTQSKKFGISMDNTKKLNGLMYLKDWLYKVISVDGDGNRVLQLHYIRDIPFLTELIKFKYGGNFDSISSAIIYPYIKKERLIKNINVKPTTKKTTISAIGLYNY